jgi:carbonic anhydrase
MCATERKDPIQPAQALAWLKEGNERFIAQATRHPNLTPERIVQTAEEGQHPFATLLSCSDSRVPVELVLDQGIGDLFVVRIAGNVAHGDEIGTIEFGVAYLGTPLLLVMGHTMCGAVTAMVEERPLTGRIPKLLENMRAPIKRARARGYKGAALILDATKEVVRQTLEDIRARSDIVDTRVREGRLLIAGALYHTESGRVEWF